MDNCWIQPKPLGMESRMLDMKDSTRGSWWEEGDGTVIEEKAGEEEGEKHYETAYQICYSRFLENDANE